MKRVMFVVVIALLALVALTGGGVVAASTQSVAANTNWDPSGVAMPVGDLPGWHQVFADNFANEAYPLGSFTGCNIRGCAGLPSGFQWGAKPDGTPHPGAFCQDYASKTVSISGGLMNIWLHTDPTTGVCMGAILIPKIPSLTYGMYQVRFRADEVPGYKAISLLWPEDNVSGEIDMPETLDLTHVIHGALHQYARSQPYLVYNSNVLATGWHTAIAEWTPTTVTFILDSTVLGTSTIWVPQKAMTLSTGGNGQIGANAPPAPSAQGNIQIDWVTVYSYSSAPPTSSPVSSQTPSQGARSSTPAINRPSVPPKATNSRGSGSAALARPGSLASRKPSEPVPTKLGKNNQGTNTIPGTVISARNHLFVAASVGAAVLMLCMLLLVGRQVARRSRNINA